MPAGDVERSRDHVADFDLVDRIADPDDFPDVLMAEDAALFEVGPALVHVQVEPQMLVAVIRTSASVGFSILASGTSSTLTLRGPWYTTAFTRISFGSVLNSGSPGR